MTEPWQSPLMDPKRLGWFDWKILDTDNLEINFVSDTTVQFYGFDLSWECAELKAPPVSPPIAQIAQRKTTKTCRILSGENGIISNPRVKCSSGTCYLPSKEYCWTVRSSCVTTKGFV